MSKTLDCGCVIFSASSFTYCHLHEAAPDLLSALGDMLSYATSDPDQLLISPGAIRRSRAAIEAAIGRKDTK